MSGVIDLIEHPSEILDRFELRASKERRIIFSNAVGDLKIKHTNEKLMQRMEYLKRLVGICAKRNERFQLNYL